MNSGKQITELSNLEVTLETYSVLAAPRQKSMERLMIIAMVSPVEYQFT
jgi:hypothetical protein